MTLGIGIIGFGVMGRTHASAYHHLRDQGLPVELLGVASPRAGGGSGSPAAGNLSTLAAAEDAILPASATRYPTVEALLADPGIHAVSITTWTETHVPLALAALAAGKHVLVEKPVALASAEVERLANAVPAGLVCMPAFCMRFWPGWPWLRDRIRDGEFGALRSLHLWRLGEPPAWATEFYGDPARSGGALFDLHIHDADFVRWCLGEPASIHSVGSLAHVTTSYGYLAGPPQVVAEGGHIPVAGFGFRMRYRAIFEHAVAEFDHAREDPVLVTRDGATAAAEIPAETAYQLQARHFVEQCLGIGSEPLRATMADAVAVTRLLEIEAGQVVR